MLGASIRPRKIYQKYHLVKITMLNSFKSIEIYIKDVKQKKRLGRHLTPSALLADRHFGQRATKRRICKVCAYFRNAIISLSKM